MLNSGLVVMDTSLEILNAKSYEQKDPVPSEDEEISTFLHVMAINRLAKSAGHWTGLFTAGRQTQLGLSGPTGLLRGSSQWLVLDYNFFLPGKDVNEHTLYVIEQVPGKVHGADMSHLLREQTYWASYNRPYFEEVREISGHTAAEQTYGDLYSYGKNPRALIFNDVGPHLETLSNMRSIMNQNKYGGALNPYDTHSEGGPGHAISARMDLDPALGGIPNGGIDAKVTSKCLFKKLQCQASSGPTHDAQPVFRWLTEETGTELFPDWPHAGLPNVWNFGWVQMTPRGAQNINDPGTALSCV